ncbi:MAG TPA: GNAT family N-acetyltransferase [Actinocrinis sp.]|nr:GNAT family N-acetyltransferase [Actinocrinis sp.]
MLTEPVATASEPRPALVPPPGHVLDRSVWESLTGHHARFAEHRGRAARYHPDVAPFVALADPADPRAWADAAELVGPGGSLSLTGPATWPDGWEVQFQGESVQLVDTGLAARPDPEAVRLGPDDVPQILELIDRTRPGPFRPRTIELGTYLGIRRGGVLVAMAGERRHPPGWTEISAVCTDEAFRGHGLATRLVRAVAAGIRDRGETPFMHANAANTNAIRLYESLGFTLRSRTLFTSLHWTAA